MSLLRRIEKSVDGRLRSLFSAGRNEPGAREEIELYRDALEQIANRASVGRNGARVFAFDLITIELRAGGPERKAILETLFDPGHMVQDLRAALEEERIEAPENLTVMVHYPENAASDLRIACEKTPKPADAPMAVLVRELRRAALSMMDGDQAGLEFTMDRPRINVGREQDVFDSTGRLMRRNDLYFPDGAADAVASISRAHAHISFDSATGDWRIYDDGSSFGTCLFRHGKRIDVSPHGSRGVALRPGDEIYLGQMRLKFSL